MIEAQDLTVEIGRRRIVSGVDFQARAGEITVIVGPNGSGKTTFLKALCGELAYGGRVSLNGQDLAAMKPVKAAGLRAVLPQAAVLAFPFTVREVVRLGLVGGRSGVSAGEEGRLPERALARVDLDGFAGRFYQELSGGEQQRVQLARVLCQVWAPVLDGQPRYLFLDEPVSSLDIRHQLTIMDIARDFAGQGGGVVAILHDLNLAAMYADRLCVMHRGQLSATGAPGDILDDRLVETVFGCRLQVGKLPPKGMPFVLPQSVY
ncbi:heme ABC transporter ATP-binding protein [Manganibacter manganicus]|uniref:Heme ABC transporter ATP-binding protein n=1 Tax=Manganibacter manganicus TaxID=1873176 RepID=A0A1V8RWG1_9HYPH|nr:heme ABC transporter ATP-binding protein [Pseudaminobacter manganicus]OQM77527.1 heme ABC transporter ATP-binding protein [Pseudaminobacter manganicus]